MRIPGWVFILSVVGLVALTALCSVVSFSAMQRVVVDLGASGVQASNPLEAVRVALNSRGSVGGVGFATSAPANDFEAFLAAQPTVTTTAQPTATATLEPGETPLPVTPAPTATLDPLAGIPEWTDPRQFTVLLLGIDQRTGVQDEEQYFRTDTMMVVNIDPVRQRAGVLSIPRDLWVSIPNFSEGRINTANALGDSNSYPGGGGPALAAETVQAALGIEIDRYLLVNFDVFLRVVDLVAPDGVEVCVEEEIDDPKYPDGGYGFNPIHFDPGCQSLEAERLLQYARTRATEGGDFDRARRQQQVLTAMREEVLSAGGIANFVTQIPALWDELSGSFRTNMTLEEILSLGALAQEIEREDIHFGVIDNMSVTFAQTSSGDQVLIPNYNAIRELIRDTFFPQDDLTLADLRQRAEAENARVVVFNNTDTQGLAGQTQEWLISQGVSVESVGNVPEATNSDTVIRNYTDKTWTARYLAALLGLPSDRVQRGGDGLTTADVMVVVGPDIQPLLTGE